MKKLIFASACFLAAFFGGCSEPTGTSAKKSAEKPEAITGETALWRMYRVARTWAPDAQVLELSSVPVQDVPAAPGKAAAWRATFTSAAGGLSRSYTYSVVEELPDLHQGVFAGQPQGWSGSQGLTSPFLIAAVKTDSDAAYDTALKSGGSEYDKKEPGKPITILLEKTNKYPDPAWRVVWGESVGTSAFSVFVDATTGKFLERMH
jgi:hypothetical protein